MLARASLLALLVVAACRTKPAEPPPATAAPATHADPWVPSDAAKVDDPKWAHDPPDVLRDKILSVNAHLDVLKTSAAFAEYRDVLATVERTPGVVAAEPFVFVELHIASAKHPTPASIAFKGVDPDRVTKVLGVARQMKTGTLAALRSGDPPSILLGDDLAKTLAVQINDEVTLTAPPDAPASWPAKQFRVAGTFHADFDEYDERLAYASLAAVQAMLQKGDQVMGVEAKVADVAKAGDIAKQIEVALGGPPYHVLDWYELNKQLFTTLYGSQKP